MHFFCQVLQNFGWNSEKIRKKNTAFITVVLTSHGRSKACIYENDHDSFRNAALFLKKRSVHSIDLDRLTWRKFLNSRNLTSHGARDYLEKLGKIELRMLLLGLWACRTDCSSVRLRYWRPCNARVFPAQGMTLLRKALIFSEWLICRISVWLLNNQRQMPVQYFPSIAKKNCFRLPFPQKCSRSFSSVRYKTLCNLFEMTQTL